MDYAAFVSDDITAGLIQPQVYGMENEAARVSGCACCAMFATTEAPGRGRPLHSSEVVGLPSAAAADATATATVAMAGAAAAASSDSGAGQDPRLASAGGPRLLAGRHSFGTAVIDIDPLAAAAAAAGAGAAGTGGGGDDSGPYVLVIGGVDDGGRNLATIEMLSLREVQQGTAPGAAPGGASSTRAVPARGWEALSLALSSPRNLCSAVAMPASLL
eukprot:SAG22_NODE_46_length_24705_cov_89.861010_11_plen_217_part_00